MAGSAFTMWLNRVKPYYFGASKEMWPGIIIMACLYYKVSYGGNKAVKDKPAH